MNELSIASTLWGFGFGLAVGFFIGQIDISRRIIKAIKWELFKR